MAPPNPRKKNTSPSRRRYEAKNPVVSVRVPRDLYDALMEFKESLGQSMADVLKLGLELARPDLEKAWNQGFEAAQEEYEVSFRCNRCRRRHLSITTDEEKKDAASMMYKAGWYDPDCRTR